MKAATDKVVKARVLDSGRNHDRDSISLAFGLVTPEESLAIQSQKDEADINSLVKRFGVAGLAAQEVRRPTYGDFTGVNDYREAMDALNEAMASFMAMSAETRHRFHNDPAEFVAFCSDDKNLEEMRKMGLAVPVPEKETTLADVVSALKERSDGGYDEAYSDAGVTRKASDRRAGGHESPTRGGPGDGGPSSQPGRSRPGDR